VQKLDKDGPDAKLTFWVSDTGIGISPEKMDLLFKRFSQVDGSVTRRHSGTGLGLAISKQLVELMGGTIHAQSEVGKGSIFSFTLPFSPALEFAAPGGAPDEAPSLSPIVMDDSELSRVLAQNTMQTTADRIVIVENVNGDAFERCSRVRLGKNGEIVFDKTPKPAKEDVSREIAELDQVLQRLKALVDNSDFSLIEETAHSAKKLALRIEADELADLAFKTELATRKHQWNTAADYCLKMFEEFTVHYKEG
jgi:HPt (histidine-containing phosphotransfer) domain-containing protein